MPAPHQQPVLRAVEEWSARLAKLQAQAGERTAKAVEASWKQGSAKAKELTVQRVPTPQDWMEYSVDLAQRWLIFLDILRKRGNQYFELEAAGNPPVLVYQYETLIDARTLERPANYALLRIVPPEGMTIDPEKRPFVVVDPRAGHGPGIGGFKEDSEVGEALRAGHSVYFVSFYPDPVPGQTLGDVAAAEELFLKEVAARHPKAGKPVVIVLDNGPIHVSKASLAALAERAHWLTVEWLPKYAPELNDIEIVWGDLKAHHLAHQTFIDADALDQAIHRAVAALNSERNRDLLGDQRISA